MNRSVILSGEQLVTKGATKIDATLPEIGLKDVTPNGSWLEQKQIQAALEARKHLIEAERIEKCGMLSQADWHTELMLAEVTRKVGSYWQYIGHNVGEQLFLYPEEALFLMEVNCLQLKHNDITVSLQQAYSLLLCGKISIIQYKVYASLSRLGYRVFRYRDSKPTSYEKKLNLTSCNKKNTREKQGIIENSKNESNDTNNGNKIDTEIEIQCEGGDTTADSGTHAKKDTCNIAEKKFENENGHKTISELNYAEIQSKNPTNNSDKNNYKCPSISKLQKLRNRQNRISAKKDLHKCFENVPDLFQKHIITVKASDDQYLPTNISLNNRSYVLNLGNIKKNTSSHTASDSRTYSISDEANGAHVRRVRSSSVNDSPQNNWIPPLFPNNRPPRHIPQFRSFNFWRSRSNFNFFHFNLFYQRPLFNHFFNFSPRFQFYPRSPPLFFRPVPNLINFNISNDTRNITSDSRKRTRDSAKISHLETIKRSALRLKLLIQAGNRNESNILALQRLLQTYNTRYKTRLRFTEEFDIINDETIIDSIELDDDEESRNKRTRLENYSDNVNENLSNLKQLAVRLKDLEAKGAACARHRRAFSNILRTFNKSYNAEIYVNNNYEIFDGRHITLESSSDSDCVIEETPKIPSGKKLRNPFNILKRLSEKQNSSFASTSKNFNVIKEDDTGIAVSETNDNKYCELLLKTFDKNWLPNENDFGRAEVPPRSLLNIRLMNASNEAFIFNFLSNQPHKYDNWLDMKIVFWKNLEQTTAAFRNESTMENIEEINSLIKPEDCTDMSSVLKKLSIIQSNKDIKNETYLKVDFDVYNKDVQNFKKSNPPKPHFRIICVNESSKFPSGADIATLHSKYDDNVGIVFAVVGVSSISYVQINQTELPVYIPSTDLP